MRRIDSRVSEFRAAVARVAASGRAAGMASLLALSGCASTAATPIAIAAPAPATAPMPVSGDSEGATGEAGGPPAAIRGDETADATEAPMGEASFGRGWLGVELESAGAGEAGVRVLRVVPRSPADKAGLLAGDVVQRLDNEPVGTPADVIGVVGSRHAGGRVGVMLRRGKADRLIAVTLGAAPSPDEIYRMSFVDQPAPEFEALGVAQGNLATTLGAQRGHVLVVEFWAPFCVACRALIPHMNQWHAQYAARGLRVVGITMEPLARAANAAAELGMSFPIFSDENGKTTRAYEARAVPAVFVIDRAGVVRDVMLGYDAARLPKLTQLVDRLVAER